MDGFYTCFNMNPSLGREGDFFCACGRRKDGEENE